MFKKVILAVVLATAGLTASAAGDQFVQGTPDDIRNAAVVDTQANGQVDVEGDWVNSGETDTVEESATARRMTQAEKAQNAAENDKFGGAITIVAMCIVLFALIVLSLLFLGFGKISSKLMSNKKLKAQGMTKADITEDHIDVDSGEVIAAIAAALAEHFDGKGHHDMEDTILTIKRMRRAYSPWNSKIYSLRELPELHPNVRR